MSRGFRDDPAVEAARLLCVPRRRAPGDDVYVVNGKEVGDPAYDVKLAWFDALARGSPGDAGSARAADRDRRLQRGARRICDVHDPDLWAGKNLASEPERDRLQRLIDWGLTDLGRAPRANVAGPFTWWDYRMGAFHRGWGLRIDLVARDGAAARAPGRRSRSTARNASPPSGEGKPSDHAPVDRDAPRLRRSAWPSCRASP